MNSQLLEFTRLALTNGVARTEVATALKQAGWAEADIKASLDAFADIEFPFPVPRPRPYLSAREVFVYLVFFVALYVSAYSLGAIAFEFIDRAFPDALQNGSYIHSSNDQIRWHVSSLIVAFPLFLFTLRAIAKAIAKDPTKRGSRPRKWLTYMTLFVAAISLIGDFISLIYNLLGGELTVRFALKVATVAAIAGGISAYLLMDMRKDEKS